MRGTNPGYRGGRQEGMMRAYYDPVELAAPPSVQYQPATHDCKIEVESISNAKSRRLNLPGTFSFFSLRLCLSGQSVAGKRDQTGRSGSGRGRNDQWSGEISTWHADDRRPVSRITLGLHLLYEDRPRRRDFQALDIDTLRRRNGQRDCRRSGTQSGSLGFDPPIERPLAAS